MILSVAFILMNLVIPIQTMLDQKPLGLQKVRVVVLDNGQEVFSEEIQTDRAGKAKWNFKPSKRLQVVTSLTVDGLQYFGFSAIEPETTVVSPVVIQAFRRSSDPAGLFLREVRTSYEPLRSGIQVQQEWVFENIARTVFAPKQGEFTFQFEFPAQAFAPEWGASFDLNSIQNEGRMFRVFQPLTPGFHHFSVTYALVMNNRVETIAQTFIPKPEALRFSTQGVEILSPTLQILSQKPFGRGLETLFKPIAPSNEGLLQVELKRPASWLTHVWAPWVVLLLALLIAAYFRRKNTPKVNPSGRALQQLRDLERLKSQLLIGDAEYESRRLLAIEELVTLGDFLDRPSREGR